MTVFHGEMNPVHRVSGLAGVYDNNDNNHLHHQPSADPMSRSTTTDDDEFDALSSLSSTDSGYFGSYTAEVGQQPHRQELTPPDDEPTERKIGAGSIFGVEATAWMEIWDYQGGASFLAFVAENFITGEKSLFVFFDAGVVGYDLKKALVAILELAEMPLKCERLVVCIDRSIEAADMLPLTKGLQWAGFELETLDHWAGVCDVTSEKWLFMGVEV